MGSTSLSGPRQNKEYSLCSAANRLYGMCSADCVHAGFGKTKVPYLALGNQFLHRTSHVFDRHIRINTVLIEQINVFGA
jgi:hypothetical protein